MCGPTGLLVAWLTGWRVQALARHAKVLYSMGGRMSRPMEICARCLSCASCACLADLPPTASATSLCLQASALKTPHRAVTPWQRPAAALHPTRPPCKLFQHTTRPPCPPHQPQNPLASLQLPGKCPAAAAVAAPAAAVLPLPARQPGGPRLCTPRRPLGLQSMRQRCRRHLGSTAVAARQVRFRHRCRRRHRVA